MKQIFFVFLIIGTGISASCQTPIINNLSKFINTTGTLDNSIIYDNGTNVGIGTTNPSTIFELGAVAPAVSLTPAVYAGMYRTQLGVRSDATGVLILGNNGNNEIRFGNNNTGGSGSIYVNNTQSYNIATSGTLAMAFSSNGKVGIGNATPLSKLSVTGYSASAYAAGTAGNAIFEITTGTGINADNRLEFGVHDGDYSWIQAIHPGIGYRNLLLNSQGGNVGIGTTTPYSKLHIGRGIDYPDVISYTASAQNEGLLFNNYFSIANSSRRYGDIISLGNADGATGGSVLRFITNPEVSLLGVERMRIERNGNVGIGASSPEKIFHIQGYDPTILLSNSQTNAGKLQIDFRHLYTGNSKVAIISTSTGSWSKGNLDFAINNADDASGVTIADSKLQISTAGTKVIGAFALNTTPVNNELNLAPSSGTNFDLKVSSANNNGNSIISLNHYAGAISKAAIISQAAGSWSLSTGIRFAINNTSDGTSVSASDTKMFISPDGAVGIGTTTPNAALSLRGSAGLLGIGSESAPTEAKPAEIYQNYTGTSDAFGLKLLRYQFVGPNTNLYGIHSTAGAYEIGSNTLTNAYGIYGTTFQGGTGSLINAYSIFAASPSGNITNKWNVYADGSAPNYFGGQVMIGIADKTKAGTYSLAVNGDAIFNKVRIVAASHWADYVFEDSYSLMPLADLAKYIKINKHLPEVPTTADVEKEGTDIGNTQTLLLKKVEELTLYAIEQNNKAALQQQQIDLLIQELATLKKLYKLDVNGNTKPENLIK